MIDHTTSEELQSLETFKREADLAEAFRKSGMPENLARTAAIGVSCNSPDLLKKAVTRHQKCEWAKRENELAAQEKQKREHERQQKQPGEQMSDQDLEALEREVMQSMGMA